MSNQERICQNLFDKGKLNHKIMCQLCVRVNKAKCSVLEQIRGINQHENEHKFKERELCGAMNVCTSISQE